MHKQYTSQNGENKQFWEKYEYQYIFVQKKPKGDFHSGSTAHQLDT